MFNINAQYLESSDKIKTTGNYTHNSLVKAQVLTIPGYLYLHIY